MSIYRGPIIDAHHHLWSYGAGHHRWLDLTSPDEGEGLPMGDLAPLRRDFLVDDYLTMCKSEGIRATVHVEAGWAGSPPGAETAFLDRLDRSLVAARHVFRVDLAAANAGELIQSEARHPRAVGLRDIVAWHPDPARSFAAAPGRMLDPAWRRGLSALAETGLVFDLMLYPHQMAEASRLAADFPNLMFVLNHCGSPADRSSVGMNMWRTGLARLAEHANLTIKISNPVAYDHNWTEDSLSDVMLTCFSAFGPDRAMFGSDAPVSGLQASFGELLGVYRRVFADFGPDVQRAFFHDTAARIYRLVDGA